MVQLIMKFLVQKICLILLLSTMVTCIPSQARGSRSLEEIPYLPPDNTNIHEMPYLPPSSDVPLSLVPPDSIDYLPPETAASKVKPESSLLHISAIAEGERTEVYTDNRAGNVNLNPVLHYTKEVDTNFRSSIPTTYQQLNDEEGYFYPKPARPLELPTYREAVTEEPLDTQATTIAQESEENSDRNVRSPQRILNVQTNPSDGPVRISALNFQLKKMFENSKTSVGSIPEPSQALKF